MSDEFDPYREWLGIKSPQRPPHYYDLLGLSLFESDSERIEEAFDTRYALVRKYQVGDRSELALRLQQELSKAHVCLCDERRRGDYDTRLRKMQEVHQTAAAGGRQETVDEEQLMAGVVAAPKPPPDAEASAAPPQLPAHAAPEATVTPELDAAVFVVQLPDGRRFGPLTQTQLDRAVVQSRLPASAQVWREGWLQAIPLTELYPMLATHPDALAAAPQATRAARYRRQDPQRRGGLLYLAIAGLSALAAIGVVAAAVLYSSSTTWLATMGALLAAGWLLLACALYESQRLFNSRLARPLRGWLGDAGTRYAVFGAGLLLFAFGFAVLGIQSGVAMISQRPVASSGPGNDRSGGSHAGGDPSGGDPSGGDGSTTDGSGQSGSVTPVSSGPLEPLQWHKVQELPNVGPAAIADDGRLVIGRLRSGNGLEAWTLGRPPNKRLLPASIRSETELALPGHGRWVAAADSRQSDLLTITQSPGSLPSAMRSPLASNSQAIFFRIEDPGGAHKIGVFDGRGANAVVETVGAPQLLAASSVNLIAAWQEGLGDWRAAVWRLPLRSGSKPVNQITLPGKPSKVVVSADGETTVFDIGGEMRFYDQQLRSMGGFGMRPNLRLCLIDRGGVLAANNARGVQFRRVPDGSQLGSLDLGSSPTLLVQASRDSQTLLASFFAPARTEVWRRGSAGTPLAGGPHDNAPVTPAIDSTPPTTPTETTDTTPEDPPATTTASRPAWAAPEDAPVLISGISPARGGAGTQVTLTGRGLGQTVRVVCAQPGGREGLAEIVQSSDTQLQIRLPSSLDRRDTVVIFEVVTPQGAAVTLPRDAPVVDSNSPSPDSGTVAVLAKDAQPESFPNSMVVLVQPGARLPRTITSRVYLLSGGSNSVGSSRTQFHYVPDSDLTRSGIGNQFLPQQAIFPCPVDRLFEIQ